MALDFSIQQQDDWTLYILLKSDLSVEEDITCERLDV